MILFLHSLRNKLSYALKAFLALAIMIILAVQLLGVARDAVDYYQRWLNRNNPHGNPMKVYMEESGEVLGGDDRILRKIMKNYGTDQK